MHLFTLAQQQHVYGFEGRTSEVIFIGGFGLMVVVAMLVARMSFRNWLLAGMLFVTCIAPSVDTTGERFNPTWMFWTQYHHADLHLALGVFLSIVVAAGGALSLRQVSAQGVILFFMAIYAGLLQFYHDDAQTALEAIGFAIATIPCFVFAIGRAVRTHEGVWGLLRTIMWVSVLWAFCSSVQFVINPKYMLSWGGRFYGMLGNAQHAAVMVAPMAVIALWLSMNDTVKRRKILWIALIAINMLFLGWTGSRTGGMMFIIGVSVVLYRRLGSAVLLMPLAALMLWGLAYLADALSIDSNLARFLSTENTRPSVISSQLHAALESPLLGVGWRNDFIASENSYFGGLGAYGIGYFLLILCLVGVSMWQCFRFNVQKKWIAREHRPLIDLFTAFNLMFFAGATFEGYLLARSFVPTLMLMVFAAIGLWIRDEIAANQAASADHAMLQEELEYGEIQLAHE
jgi:hypothetical protein